MLTQPNIIKGNNTVYQIYLDKNELYMAFSLNEPECQLEAKINMEKCIQDIGNVIFENKMKRNDEK